MISIAPSLLDAITGLIEEEKENTKLVETLLVEAPIPPIIWA